MGIPLQIAEPTGRYQRNLRRFRYSKDSACPAGGYCDATAAIGEIPAAEAGAHGDNWPHADPRWPAACAACGVPFTDGDHWQRNDCRIYRLPDGTEFAWWGDPGKVAPPGTMVRAEWHDRTAAEGESWVIVLPDGGTWITTQLATDGGRWAVTGTPPRISVSPSIWHDSPHGWHGFIRDGVLEDA